MIHETNEQNIKIILSKRRPSSLRLFHFPNTLPFPDLRSAVSGSRDICIAFIMVDRILAAAQNQFVK